MNKQIALFICSIIAINAFAQNLENGHEYVDLGLTSGTLWATCNIGAETPEANGNYYAWGEIETKSDYQYDNHNWFIAQKYSIEKPGNAELNIEDDVAAQTWGGKWRMPTREQMEELRNECYWVYSLLSPMRYFGYMVYKAKNENDKGKHILPYETPSENYNASVDTHLFLPATGVGSPISNSDLGFYWSKTLAGDIPQFAWRLGFGFYDVTVSTNLTWVGYEVRAVINNDDSSNIPISFINDNGENIKTIEDGLFRIIWNNKKYDLFGRNL